MPYHVADEESGREALSTNKGREATETEGLVLLRLIHPDLGER